MGMNKNTWKKATCIAMASGMVLTATLSEAAGVEAAAKKTVKSTISYTFKGNDAKTAGFAQGTITLKAKEAGTYYLYWANNKEALSGYYEIAKLKAKKGESKSFTFGEQTAIPADATKVIAIKSTTEPKVKTVAKADAVYNISASKQLGAKSKEALYTFNSYSDIHIDEEKWGSAPGYWWEYSENHWAKALEYAAGKKVDFIVSSGDQVTNASADNVDKEWKVYQNILAGSSYVNPIYECGGNHEVRQDNFVERDLKAYVKGTGLDSSLATINGGKSYYSMTEPKTGDLFLFMSLEKGYRANKYDEFTQDQLDWLEKTLQENYGKGKNIYLIQHALISGYGAGDDIKTPYYGGAMNPELETAKKFVSIIEKYPDIVWISGHSHEDYSLGYNYSNNNGTSCNMIHNSSVGNPTHVVEKDGKKEISYDFFEDNSQGYYVQAFDNAIVFNGSNLVAKKIYPAYSYIIKGNTQSRYDVEEKYTMTDSDKTSGNVNSLIDNVKCYLAVNYQYSSYDQYQLLKKTYYQYKKADTKKMTQKERNVAYSKLSTYLTKLAEIIKEVPMD